ncbi:MAG TPA: ankyrin repeat domain-containing protein [Candidatus Acidoferrum sp.]|jgi:ankyrin repeat protein|nr:ankyrin repeat domain-containing protein [Candidatus Acidoferrum sp.]
MDGTVDLFDLIELGDLANVRLLIQREPRRLHLRSTADWTSGDNPLHAAAGEGRADIARFFLDVGSRIEDVNESGYTALHRAAQNGHEEVVTLLLQRGARIEAVTPQGRTALHLAARYGLTSAVELLLKNGANPCPVGIGEKRQSRRPSSISIFHSQASCSVPLSEL